MDSLPDKPDMDKYNLSPAELEMLEDDIKQKLTGKPVNRGSVARNVEAMQGRLAVLQGDLKHLAHCVLSETDPERCAQMMADKRGEIKKVQQQIDLLLTLPDQNN